MYVGVQVSTQQKESKGYADDWAVDVHGDEELTPLHWLQWVLRYL